jgi:hypothetical protein
MGLQLWHCVSLAFLDNPSSVADSRPE